MPDNSENADARHDALTRELAERKRAHEASERELKLRDDFFSAIAHELRNPLNAIHLTLAGLLRAQSGSSPLANEQIVARVNRASTQVDRLAKLVDDMLDVNRISGGRLQLQPEEFDSAAAATEVVARFRAQPDAPEISLSAPASLVMRWDRPRFEQMISNLLSNAIKYGERKPIAVRLAGHDSGVRLTVADQGVGIAEDDQERIFGRFERVKKSTPSAAFGIGLWVVRETVRAHGGEIRVISKPGAGATFIVDLPKLRAEAAASTAENP